MSTNLTRKPRAEGANQPRLAPAFDRDVFALVSLHDHPEHFLSRAEVRLNLAAMGVRLVDGDFKIPAPPSVLRAIEPVMEPSPEPPPPQADEVVEDEEEDRWWKQITPEEEA